MNYSTPFTLPHIINNFIPVTAREAVETVVQSYGFALWQVSNGNSGFPQRGTSSWIAADVPTHAKQLELWTHIVSPLLNAECL